MDVLYMFPFDKKVSYVFVPFCNNNLGRMYIFHVQNTYLIKHLYEVFLDICVQRLFRCWYEFNRKIPKHYLLDNSWPMNLNAKSKNIIIDSIFIYFDLFSCEYELKT